MTSITTLTSPSRANRMRTDHSISRRRALTTAAIAFGIIAAGLAAWPFIASLSPSASAGQSLPHLYVGDLRPGDYRYFDSGFRGRSRREHFLVIRQNSGTYSAFVIGIADGRFVMPDIHEWGISGLCSKFSLPLPQGHLPDNGLLQCLDHTEDGRLNDKWKWDSDGNNVSHHYADFIGYRFVIEDGDLVIGKWR